MVYPPNAPVVHPDLGLIRVIDPTTGAVLNENNTDVTSSLSTVGKSPDSATVYLTNSQFLYGFDVTSADIPLSLTHDFTGNHLPAFPTTDDDAQVYVFVTVISGGTTYHLYKLTAGFVFVYDKTPFTLTDAGGHRDFIEVSGDGLTLYWAEVNAGGTQSILHAYDLVNDIALPDVLTSTAGEVIKRIHRDPLNATRLYFNTQDASGMVVIYHCTTAGAILTSFTVTPLATARVSDFGVSPDGLSVWTSGRTTGGGASTLRQWLVSDGSMIEGFTDSPDVIYGNLTVLEAASATLTVRKVSAPVVADRSWDFSVTPDLSPETFTLAHGEEQIYENVPAGVYDVHESNSNGWVTSYSVSNGDDPGAITIANGDDIVVTVTNSLPYQTIRRLRRAWLPNEEMVRIICDRFEVDLQAGLGTTGDIAGIERYASPRMMVRFSKDAGQTWGPEREMTAGEIGMYSARTFITQNGQNRKGMVEISVSDPVVGWYLTQMYGTFRKGTS